MARAVEMLYGEKNKLPSFCARRAYRSPAKALLPCTTAFKSDFEFIGVSPSARPQGDATIKADRTSNDQSKRFILVSPTCTRGSSDRQQRSASDPETIEAGCLTSRFLLGEGWCYRVVTRDEPQRETRGTRKRRYQAPRLPATRNR